MKSANTFTRIAATLLCLLAFATASFAATPAIELPRGLAVDAKGNLYVANVGGNNILVYSPGYVLQKSKIITQGINTPFGVAFDLLGDLWVANNGNNSITEYIGGKQNTNATIPQGVGLSPQSLAFDGTGNLWVQDSFTYLIMYEAFAPYTFPKFQQQSISTGQTYYGIATAVGGLWVGGSTQVTVFAAAPLMLGDTNDPINLGGNTGFTMASDASGKVYICNLDGSVQIGVPVQQPDGTGTVTVTSQPFLQLSFVPTGIAIDNARKRIYLSNYNANSISVYSTAGVLLQVIQ